VLLMFFVFVLFFVSYYVSLRSEFRVMCVFFAYSGVQHILCCVFVLFSWSCVPYVASFSVLFFVVCPFGIL
jgi:hypothetical protein